YVVRETCSADRQVVYASLTEKGLDFIDRTRVEHVERLREYVLGPLGSKGVRQLTPSARTRLDSALAKTRSNNEPGWSIPLRGRGVRTKAPKTSQVQSFPCKLTVSSGAPRGGRGH